MLRGTRIIEDATAFNAIVTICRSVTRDAGYTEIIVPSIWEQRTFTKKAGAEILNQMYAFQDKGDPPRDICLIPEVTAIIQEQYKADWSKRMPKPVKVCYLSRCYRYERPQAGRYREFWQWGVELLGGDEDNDWIDVQFLLRDILESIQVSYSFSPSVKRGLEYYIEDGFEAECESLEAQKQIAGGGRYDCGIGFAIGIDRVLEALK
jgi:histidyl-tRNA synthetase